MSEEKKIPKYAKFILGGLAGMSGIVFVHPLDLIKTRMQMGGVGGVKKYGSTADAFKQLLTKEGPSALFTGLSAALLRQASYTTTRLGVYSWLFESFSKDGQAPGFAAKAIIGMVAGVSGSFVGVPTEVALIRMTADGQLPPSERRNYRNVFHAWYRIVKEEGVLTLWRGAIPTMARAMVVNAAQLATYSQCKEFFKKTGYFDEGVPLHFCASMASGVVTTIASLPVDIAKTRIQNMKVIDGKPEYSGFVDAVLKITAKEGPFALWKGFTPYYAKLGPHTVLMFIFLEQYTLAYKKFLL